MVQLLKDHPVKKLLQFFATRFFLGDPSVWRLMCIMKPMRIWIVIANILLTFAGTLGGLSVIGLLPLVSMTLHSAGERDKAPPVVVSQPAPAKVSSAVPSQAAPAESVLKPKEGKSKNIIFDVAMRSPLLKGAAEKLIRRWEAFTALSQADPKRFITYYCGLLLLLMLVQGLVQFGGDYLMGLVAVRTTSGLMRQLYSNALRQEMLFFNNTPTGQLLNTCYRELFELQPLITLLSSTRIILPINMIIFFFFLLAISPALSVLLLVMLPIVILPMIMLTRSIKSSMRREMDEEYGAMDVLAQGFHGIQAIKAFGAEELETRNLEPCLEQYVHSSRVRRITQSVTGPMVDMLNMIVMLLIFAAAIFFLPHSLRKPADIIVFMGLLIKLYRPMRTVMTMNVRMTRARQVCKHIFALLDRKPEIADAPDAVDFPRPWNEMILGDVHLAYKIVRKGQERHHRALRGVRMKIRRGEAVALVGPNGAGKSSIVNAICRLYDVTGGEIRIDDVPLRRIRLASLRENICLITQHPVLFNRSVADNIAFGLEGIGREEIIEAAKATRAHEFIENLAQGYDTFVGEQGRLLSGGERQKIVLARAFVRRPQILILDEPTSGLDRQTQMEFLDLVTEMHEHGITIIYITHEFSQLNRFERVFRLTPERKVVEEKQEAIAALGSRR